MVSYHLSVISNHSMHSSKCGMTHRLYKCLNCICWASLAHPWKLLLTFSSQISLLLITVAEVKIFTSSVLFAETSLNIEIFWILVEFAVDRICLTITCKHQSIPILSVFNLFLLLIILQWYQLLSFSQLVSILVTRVVSYFGVGMCVPWTSFTITCHVICISLSFSS